MVKTLPASAEEVDLIPGPERSPGEGVGDPLSWVSNSLSYFLPGKSRGQTSLGSMGSQRVGHNLVTEQQQCFNNIIEISFHIPYNLPT